MQDDLKKHGYFKIAQNIFLLNSKNQFLVLQHKSGKWLLPGGRLNKEENWLQGLKREIKEETGVSNFKVNSIFKTDTWDLKGDSYFGVFYIGEINDSDIVLSDEHKDYKWIDKLEQVNALDFWNQDLKDKILQFYRKYLIVI